MSWSAPTFAENFEPVKFQQGNDAHFVATVAGNPKPEVRWSRKGQPLTSSGDKFEVSYDPNTGKVSLKIKNIGPGDEGGYSCTISNPYGHTTATLSVNPDLGRRHRGLSPGCCRATLQRKLQQQQSVNGAQGPTL